MDIVGKLGDPVADVAALTPLVMKLEQALVADLVKIVVPALESALSRVLADALVGRTITIKIT